MWTPVLLHSERRDGVPRHVQVARLTSIRECCIADRHARAAWWDAIVEDVEELQERGVVGDLANDPRLERILSVLAAVVPPQTRRGRAGATHHARWGARPRRDAPAAPTEPTEATCFAILGLSAKCTDAELKRAWRRAAAEHHPDRGGDGDAFRRMKRAYDLCRRVRGIA